MVFTSIPAAYLDAANWQHQQQQQQNHQQGNTGSHSQQLLPPQLPPPPAPQPHGAGGGGAGSIRPGSMADRARMANLPMPEAALKCPRCDSTNTKFCYFNNYSLSQPRHFCKTCRRYWTRGGALRNVPVGGGCRRSNKRSKGTGGGSSSSKSPASSDRQTGSGASSTNSVSTNSGAAAPSSADHILGLSPHLPPLRFMPPLHHHHQLADLAAGGSGEMALNYGLNYGSISGGGVGDLSFQIGNPLGLDQWRVPQTQQQFPFLAGLELGSSQGGGGSGCSMYPFEGGAEVITGYGVTHHHQNVTRSKISTTGLMTQLASVKMEDSSNRELSLSSSQFLLGNNNNNNNNNNNVQVAAISGGDHHHHHHHQHQHQQYWTGGTSAAPSAWTDISGFSSSSTTSNNQL